MALTGWGFSNLLRRTSPVWGGAEPLFVSAWCYRATGSSAAGAAFGLGAATDPQRRVLFAAANDHAQCQAYAATSPSGADVSSPVLPNNTWFHMCGAWISTTSRNCWLAGANKATDTTSQAVTAPTKTTIGTTPNEDEYAWSSTGGLAEISVWNPIGFITSDYDALARELYNRNGRSAVGGNPLNMVIETTRPWRNRLLAYWPLPNSLTLSDFSGWGNHLTMVGTLTTFASHPFIEPLNRSTWQDYSHAHSLPYWLGVAAPAAAAKMSNPYLQAVKRAGYF